MKEKYIAAIIIIVIAIIAAYTISEGITGAVIGGAVNQTKVLDNNINNTINITNASQQSEPIISPIFNKTTSSISQNQTNQTNRTIIPSGGGGGGGGGSSSGGSSCTPKTCEQLGKTCGVWDNGCGSTVDCGVCTTTVFIDPILTNTTTGKSFTINISINTNTKIYAAEVKVQFNNKTVVVSSITEGNFLKSSGAQTFFLPITDNSKGEMDISNTILGNNTGVMGTGSIATINFNSTSIGTSILNITNVKLAAPDGSLITTFTTENGNIVIN